MGNNIQRNFNTNTQFSVRKMYSLCNMAVILLWLICVKPRCVHFWGRPWPIHQTIMVWEATGTVQQQYCIIECYHSENTNSAITNEAEGRKIDSWEQISMKFKSVSVSLKMHLKLSRGGWVNSIVDNVMHCQWLRREDHFSWWIICAKIVSCAGVMLDSLGLFY